MIRSLKKNLVLFLITLLLRLLATFSYLILYSDTRLVTPAVGARKRKGWWRMETCRLPAPRPGKETPLLHVLEEEVHMQTDKQPEAPTKLPPLSRAAAAQRLNERPLPPNPGLYYDVQHNPLHPRGWYLRRHLKRKNLRRRNQLYAATERAGIRWSMLPLCFFILTLIIAAASFFAGYSAFAGAVNQHYQGAIASLVDILPGDSLRMYDEHGTMIYEALDQGLQISEPLGNISSNLVHAEIAIEDQYFWTNPGYDITGIVRAALSNLTHGHVVAGGSTITQQLIKNVVVGKEDTITRKLEEVILAPEAIRYYTKQQIMEMYLNTTYYGSQAYGAEAAAFSYFGLQDTPKATAAAQLDIAQAAMLAGS